MTKTIRQMQENMKLIDLAIEIIDARIPISSRNPDLDRLCAGKARMILFGKGDLADESENRRWMEYYEARGLHPYACDLRSRGALKGLGAAIQTACREKIERDRRRGIANRPVRAMVCGIPNVGKSTFINSFSGSSSLKTGNKPGVTKGRQWIKMNSQVELLDTPGLLWPKFSNQEIGRKIALIGSIPDANTDQTELAASLIDYLRKRDGEVFEKRYDTDLTSSLEEILDAVGRKRGALKKGGETDIGKAAGLLLDDFRQGRLGRMTLETVDDLEEEGSQPGGKE